jgi:phosphatidate cytidylyltransferase
MSDLPKRLGVALWGIPLLLLALYFGGLFLAVLISLLLFLLAREWQYLGRSVGTEIPLAFLWLSAAAVLSVQFSTGNRIAVSAAILLLLVLIVAQIVRSSRAPLRDLGHLALWLFYIVFPISLWWTIRLVEGVAETHGRLWLIALFVCVWVTDTAAYAAGRAVGKHRLMPAASPNKSWEGAIAGVFAALLVPVVLRLLGLFDFTGWDVVAFAIAVGVFGQAGDLLESLMKREAGVKDSSQFLPGHGGLLDRFDSLFLATPALYLYLFIR